jgi:hypothetical protein
MRKLGLVALALAAGAIVFSAWMWRGQDASARPEQPGITVSYETGYAYVWEWKGSEIVGLTTYKPGDASVERRRLIVTDAKK